MCLKGFSSQNINASSSKAFTFPKFLLFSLILAIMFHPAKAQNNAVKKSTELALLAANGLWTGINYSIQFSSKIRPGNTFYITGLDKQSRNSLNTKTARISDLTLLATGLFSGASLLAARKDIPGIRPWLVTAESAWMTANLVHSVKMAVLRNRPYTRAPGFTPGKRYDTYSFFSGHSALAASVVTSAFLYSRKNTASSKGQNIFTGLAGATACGTAYLRISSGKHYPSDVITGLLAGIGIAWINYQLHEK